ncbi:oxidative stress survival, Svf1-like protein [Ilyonectria robusta]|uniref:oxidative stress survival, Svf1-like protein n=1 Tax=Ilyonectria robusta TaxID=1079257 RepID=UPI001E8EA12A|nr:oxidative stress survival, Svf1-like protein [Ilyonectria robusta]KAH6996294.1 oxidative stress survival, Svf1-like protein [Ilyonectria sp. MPI-CAGE-AT-0026]KAH8735823.1 oxidative stress survival, Svf1-like protein [Ilyonectria robusta]
MFNWAKQTLANVAGTQEPIYGPTAIKSVALEAEKTPFTELKREDLAWQAMDSTSVETASFYLMGDNGYVALAQVIYSNVAGIRTTCQFNCKVFSKDQDKPHLWCSTPLNNVELSDDKNNFYADDCAVELSDDGTYYTIKSMNDDRAIVNLKITRTTPGFQVGESGQTLFGTDLTKPWGSMRHAFWPRCVAEGTISVKEGPIDFKGRALFAYALQGMKPHHAAATWNFVDYQGPNYSAILMEFTTPPSYGTTSVVVGGIAKDGEIITGGCAHAAAHTAIKGDNENSWPEPTEVKYSWSGTTKDGKAVTAVIEGSLGERSDRVDVMAEVPGFVKKIVGAAAGTKPYIYQYHPKLPFKLKIGDEEIVEEGIIFTEATFISDPASSE